MIGGMGKKKREGQRERDRERERPRENYQRGKDKPREGSTEERGIKSKSNAEEYADYLISAHTMSAAT
jgi:hypothetical protein